MDLERSTLSELRVVQGQQENTYFLHTVLIDEGESGIRLCLTDIEDVWEGQLTEDNLDLLRARLKMDFKAYVEQTVAALTREKMKDMSFEYQLKALPSNRMQLMWKKCVSGDQIKIQLGSVSLEKSSDNPTNLLRVIFAQCISSMSDLKSRIQDLESNCDRLGQDRQYAVKRLEKCVAAKEELEQDLYSKFAAVLNSKKERIRRLEEEGPQSFTADVNGSPVAGSSKHGLASEKDNNDVSPKEGNDREGGDYFMDTDSEEEKASPVKQARRTAKSKMEDTSLNLGDDEDGKVSTGIAPAARRPRRKGPVKKETPSKPVLPRASSGKSSSDSSRPGSASRRTSLRKSGSNSSAKSSDNVDPDDLLDEM